jgi:hypothetical protein
VVAAIVLALALSACIKLDIELTVKPDDTVEGAVVFAISKDLAELTGQDLDQLLQGADGLSSIEGVRTEPYEDDRFVGQRYLFEAVPISQFSGEESLEIVREGDTYRVSGTFDLSSPDVTGAQDSPLGTDFAGQIMEGAELRIAMTFPGPVIESNGQIDGNTVVWMPAMGESTEVTAVASATSNGEGGGLPVGLWGAAALIAAALITGLVVMVRRTGAVDEHALDDEAVVFPPPPPAPSPPPGSTR